ncbi:Disheveled-associated activator of morphogenesis 2, partial [Clarias magur]
MEGEGECTQEIRLHIVRRIYGAGVEPSITRVRAKDNAVSHRHLYACPHKLILNKLPLFFPK